MLSKKVKAARKPSRVLFTPRLEALEDRTLLTLPCSVVLQASAYALSNTTNASATNLASLGNNPTAVSVQMQSDAPAYPNTTSLSQMTSSVILSDSALSGTLSVIGTVTGPGGFYAGGNFAGGDMQFFVNVDMQLAFTYALSSPLFDPIDSISYLIYQSPDGVVHDINMPPGSTGSITATVKAKSSAYIFANFGHPTLPNGLQTAVATATIQWSCTSIAPTITLQSAKVDEILRQHNEDMVQVAYKTTGNTGPFKVGLYRSPDGKKYDSSAPMDIETFTPTSPNFQGLDILKLPDPLPYDSNNQYLVVVADPLHETNDVISPSTISMKTYPLAWGAGDQKGTDFITNAFNHKVVEIAHDLGITDPSWLMTVIDFESNGTFNPAEPGGGLIQLSKENAMWLGTSRKDLEDMTALQQLKYVQDFLLKIENGTMVGLLKTLADTELAVFWPKAAGKNNGYVLYTKKGSPTLYQNNAFRSPNGVITKASVAATIAPYLNDGMQSQYKGCYFDDANYVPPKNESGGEK
jgi:hypothetical protein